ncbi:unnamed protein product [Adineta ricciae]|uniref:Chitin-binding type-2 domain-containing protein n=1 Tax=Adineta ricciae TaxID=249248 RepID=A0A813TD96_ADIRI|nr:unnamed protein product [Adineta ricciae]
MIRSLLIYVQLLSMMINLHYGQDAFDCTGYEDDSFHPVYDADDCRHYWHCIYVDTVYMHAVKRVCPAGTEFDVTLKQCETSSLVDCQPPKSPHLPRTTSTTKAWKLIYSQLLSRKRWRVTMPSAVTVERYPVFVSEDPLGNEMTTMIVPEPETTEQVRWASVTLPQPTTAFSIEELSKNLNAVVLNNRPRKQKKVGGPRLLQIGEPENEAQMYKTTTKQRARRTRPTTSTQPSTELPSTTFLITTESSTAPPITTMITTTTITTSTTQPLTTSTSLKISTTSVTSLMTQPESTINIASQSRPNRRRQNMTLYILTSDEHKIRRFSVNHTRGILINCNQLRRRLLGRRRLRDVLHTTTIQMSTMKYSSISSVETFRSKTTLFIFLLTNFIINT